MPPREGGGQSQELSRGDYTELTICYLNTSIDFFPVAYLLGNSLLTRVQNQGKQGFPWVFCL